MRISKQRSLLVIAVTLVFGLSMALVLPWLAGAQGRAAELRNYPKQAEGPDVLARYYVAKTGDGSDGLNWTTAFTNVQDALAKAYLVGDAEIWVAEGVYYPDEGSGNVGDAVTSTFVMTDNVALYGGFDASETLLSERDWRTNVTVLSGDIDGNDITDANGIVLTTSHIISDNAYNVVSARGVSGTAVLDGFTITAGFANGASFSPQSYGGGMYCDGKENADQCNPTLRNIDFYGNMAKSSGGAMFNDGAYDGESSPILYNVSFYNNTATSSGGAIYNDGAVSGESYPKMTNVTFKGNAARIGGAVFNSGFDRGRSSPILINVLFSGNYAEFHGGAMYNYGQQGTSSPSFTNVTFSGNYAGIKGGALYNEGVEGGESHSSVRNSILWNNQDSSGTSTISATVVNDSATINFKNSLVQGTGGSSTWISDAKIINLGGNIDQDPIFLLPVNPATATSTAGNLRLQSSSPAIDKGFNDHVSGVLTDLDGEARIVAGPGYITPTVDMGAYEYQIPYKYDGYLPFIYR